MNSPLPFYQHRLIRVARLGRDQFHPGAKQSCYFVTGPKKSHRPAKDGERRRLPCAKYRLIKKNGWNASAVHLLRGERVLGDDEKKRAETLYRRLLNIFPKQRGNIVIFPGAEPSRQHSKKPQAAHVRPGRQSQAGGESLPEDRPHRIEELLKRLFEDLSKDD